MYKHIIWDFDGTLFDSYPVMVKAALTVLEEQGIYESYDKIMSLMKISFTHFKLPGALEMLREGSIAQQLLQAIVK